MNRFIAIYLKWFDFVSQSLVFFIVLCSFIIVKFPPRAHLTCNYGGFDYLASGKRDKIKWNKFCAEMKDLH